MRDEDRIPLSPPEISALAENPVFDPVVAGLFPFFGEMSEWSKVHAWKACVPKRYRGFESLSLRSSP